MNENLIQVLWVEDDPIITKTFPMEGCCCKFGVGAFRLLEGCRGSSNH